MQRLEETPGAGAIELTPDELREIDAATSGIKVHGSEGPGGHTTPETSRQLIWPVFLGRDQTTDLGLHVPGANNIGSYGVISRSQYTSEQYKQWAQVGSNHRPLACKTQF